MRAQFHRNRLIAGIAKCPFYIALILPKNISLFYAGKVLLTIIGEVPTETNHEIFCAYIAIKGMYWISAVFCLVTCVTFSVEFSVVSPHGWIFCCGFYIKICVVVYSGFILCLYKIKNLDLYYLTTSQNFFQKTWKQMETHTALVHWLILYIFRKSTFLLQISSEFQIACRCCFLWEFFMNQWYAWSRKNPASLHKL